MANNAVNFKDSFMGACGFDEIRKYIKQGGDFTKDVLSILQERAELELTYAKGLQKLSTKLQKSSKDILGTTAYVWQVASIAMENEAELHKNLSLSLTEDITKPLKSIVDSQHKARKSIESTVDKSHKILLERRSEEQKYKKQSYTSTKENEKLQDQTIDARNLRGAKIVSDKDLTKLEQKRRKAEESFHKSDQDYFLSCLKAERSRMDWEVAVYRANDQFQRLEEDRLVQMMDFVQKYCNNISVIGPKMIEDYSRLTEAIATIDCVADLMTVIDTKGAIPIAPEQILPDFYAEELGNSMKKERRREVLEKYLNMTKQRLELHRKEIQGVRTLSRGVNSTGNFTDVDNNQHINSEIDKMQMLQNFLEVFQYKVECTIADLENRPRPTHPLSVHLVKQRDKQGMSQVVLRIPPWTRTNTPNGDVPPAAQCVDSPDWINAQTHRRNLSAEQIQLNRSFNDGFNNTIGRCRALYVFEGNTPDELAIRPGDVITLYRKEDEWWHGELNGRVGFFPATYVEEISQ